MDLDMTYGIPRPLPTQNFWHLHDTLTLSQATFLMLGLDPEGNNLPSSNYTTLLSALKQAIRHGQLPATLLPGEPDHQHAVDFDSGLMPPDGYETDVPVLSSLSVACTPEVCDATGWGRSTVTVAALRAWLVERNFKPAFFFPKSVGVPDYMDPNHPRYAPKLAAAVTAWIAVVDPDGKSPKEALKTWLRKHAAEFDLLHEDGKSNSEGINDCAKVANWQTQGGAAKTPGT